MHNDTGDGKLGKMDTNAGTWFDEGGHEAKKKKGGKNNERKRDVNSVPLPDPFSLLSSK